MRMSTTHVFTIPKTWLYWLEYHVIKWRLVSWFQGQLLFSCVRVFTLKLVLRFELHHRKTTNIEHPHTQHTLQTHSRVEVCWRRHRMSTTVIQNKVVACGHLWSHTQVRSSWLRTHCDAHSRYASVSCHCSFIAFHK